jgi:peptidoglycan/LPS O-acetylase OafA/YrhL
VKNVYRPEIDGLRALAVIGVILYHSELLAGGFLGVDIFFVISGYLITLIIYKEYVTKKTFSFSNFYQKRIRRLVPALLVVILFSTIIAYNFLLPYAFKEYVYSVISSIFFSSNIFFHYAGQAYGANILSIKPFLHTWSLAIEEQFYLFYPIFFILIAKYFFKKINYIIILVIFISIIVSLLIERSHSSFNFYMLPSRAWELLMGGLLAIFNINNTRFITSKILTKIGLAMIAYSFFFFKDAGNLPLYYSIIPVIGCCFIINQNNKEDLVIRFLSNRFLVGIGLISYSLYLWHHPILSFDKILKISNGDLIIKIYLILLSILLAAGTYFFIEKPFRKKEFYSTKKLIITLCIILPFFLVILERSLIIQKKKFPSIALELNDKTWFKTKQFQKPCFQRIKYFCSFNENNNNKVFLLGSSIMASIQQELKESLVSRNINFIPMTRGEVANEVKNENRKNRILESNNSVIIFHFNTGEKYEGLNIFIEKIKFFLDRNYKIILLYPIPRFNKNISDIIGKKVLSKNFDYKENYISISYSEYKNKTDFATKELDKLNHQNLYKIYPHKIFCNSIVKNKCIAHNDEEIFFIDGLHLSKSGSKLINIDLMKIIDKIY